MYKQVFVWEGIEMNILGFAESLGYYPDIDGVVRIESPDDAFEFKKMAEEEGISFYMREPDPIYHGMTPFAISVQCCYRFYDNSNFNPPKQ